MVTGTNCDWVFRFVPYLHLHRVRSPWQNCCHPTRGRRRRLRILQDCQIFIVVCCSWRSFSISRHLVHSPKHVLTQVCLF